MSSSNPPPEFSSEFLNQIAKTKRVSAGELKALKIALEKNGSQEVASELGITKAAARKRLGEVYKKFKIAGKGPGKLASLKELLQAEATQEATQKDNQRVNQRANNVSHKANNKAVQNVEKSAVEKSADEKSATDVLPESISSDLSSLAGNERSPLQPTLSDSIQAHIQKAHKSSNGPGNGSGSGSGNGLSHTPIELIAPTLNSAKGLNSFYGRSRELEALSDWMGKGNGRKLLAICGMGGIGKTALAVQLVRKVRSQFEKVVWLSIEHKGEEKRPERLLKEAIAKLQKNDSSTFERENSAATIPVATLIEQFVGCLERHRALVIIDGLERVFTSYSEISKSDAQANKYSTFDVKRRQQASAYKPGFEAYYDLLSAIQVQSFQTELMSTQDREALSKEANISCVVVTSREKPRELLAINQEDTAARLQTLDGLRDEEAVALLRSFYLKGNEADYNKLISRYYGHPMALRLAGSTIKDAFFGKIRNFLDQEISVFDDLRSVIKTQFKRLSPSEKEVMYWLAINRDPCTIEDLQADIVAKDHKQNVLYTLTSLQRRFLIEVDNEKGVASYRMHPIIADYVLDRFIRSVFLDLVRGDHEMSLFNNHALMKADAEDELREFQRQNIVQPILARLNNRYQSLYEAEEILSRRLNEFRQNNRRRLGYAGGNFVNLLVQLSEGQTLHEKDFSQLTIWQAYLQGVQLRKVNFNKCELNRSVFTETISDVMAVAFTPSKATTSKATIGARTSEDKTSENKTSHQWENALMAAGDANGKIHLWSTRSPTEKRTEWVAHSGWVRAIAFVPSQTSIAPETSHRGVSDQETSYQGMSHQTEFATNSADQPRQPWLVTGGDDNRLRFWQLPDFATQTSSHSLNYPTQVWQKDAQDWVHTVAVSPDGKLIASGGNDKITLYRASDGKEINSFADEETTLGHRHMLKNRIRALAFSPDGQRLASCGDDRVVRVWSTQAVQKVGHETDALLKLKGHRALIHTVRFSADGNLLVSGGADKTLFVWDLERGEQKARFERPSDRIRSVAITNGGLLASGGDDCQIRFWNIHSLKHLKDIPTQQSRIWSVDFQQQGDRLRLLAGGDKQTLMLWEVTDSKTSVHLRPLRTYRGYTSGIRSVAFLSDQRIIGGGDRGELRVWDKEGGECKATLPFHQGRIWSLAVDREQARIASASDDHSVRLWSAETGQCLTTLTGHNNWVRSVAFSRHGRFLVSAGDDCSIRIWNTASGFCRRILDKFEAWVRSVTFDPNNSRYVIAGGDAEVVQRWDIKDGHAFSLARHKHRICSVACSPDGSLIASGSDDATVIVWDIEKGDKIHHFKNADLGIKSVAFSPDGRYLAGGGEDQLVYVWALESDDPEETCFELRPQDYQGMSGGIRSVAFSPDSRYVISGGLDEMARIGDLEHILAGSAQVMRPLIKRDRPYENTEIQDVRGLSDLQMANLMTLGAVDRTKSLLN